MSNPESFKNLSLEPSVLAALDKMGFQSMTPVQAKAIPLLLQSSDFLGQAPTGTGKTAAFGIPMVNRLQPGQGYVQALIIGPTRELVQQIAEEINAIGAEKGLKALAIYGGEAMYGQKERLRQRDVDIIVGTPGRILDHLRNVSLNLSNTRLVVLDEADIMLDMGFREDIEDIFAQAPAGRETWLFSATISPEIRRIADRYMYFPQEVRIQPQEHSAEVIDQWYYVVPEDDKPELIKHFIETIPELYGIIFCSTKKDVVTLNRKFWEKYPVDCLHGAMPQSDRDKVMEKFRNRELRLLISTDVVSRGIDIDSLTHILNSHPPHYPESYIHRIGRTARKGETGIAITLFTPQQLEEYQRLERRVGMPIQKHPDCILEFDPLPPRSRRSKSSGGRPHHRGGGRSGGHSSSGGGGGKRRPRRSGGHGGATQKPPST